jgi:hypothetical protein
MANDAVAPNPASGMTPSLGDSGGRRRPHRSLRERLEVVGGILTAATGAVAGVDKLLAEFRTSGGIITQPLPAAILAPLALGLLALGVWLLFDGLRCRSRLIQPAAFRLDARKPTQLKGRERDVEKFIADCRKDENHQIFLLGESGVGKSAFVISGLAPALENDRHLLPVVADLRSVGDWEAGPRGALLAALQEYDRESWRKRGIAKPTPGDDPLAYLVDVASKLKRVPLLIFDQVDDYLRDHRACFLEDGRRWKDAGQVAKQNQFWRRLGESAAQGVFKVVLVCRDDAAGLSSLKLLAADPPRIELHRPSWSCLAELLDEIQGPVPEKVISDPDHGMDGPSRRAGARPDGRGLGFPADPAPRRAGGAGDAQR